MANEALAETLERFAFLLELKDENPFKIKAFQNAARILADQTKDVNALIDSGEIAHMPGIGKGTQSFAAEWARKGRLEEFEALKKEFPETIFELLEVRGLGPKKSKALYKELQIASLSELEYACNENRLLDLKGFGAKTQENILKSIADMKSRKGKILLPAAIFEAEELLERIRKTKGVDRAELTGDLRRSLEVLERLEFVVSPGSVVEKLRDSFAESNSGLPVLFHGAEEKNFGTVLFETTGSEDFLKSLKDAPKAPSEEKVFSALGIEVVPPEAREFAHKKKKLVTREDLRGVFHIHTKASDGANSLEEMAEACIELGYEYMGVSEHSETAVYAGGLDTEHIKKQKSEVARLNRRYGGKFHIFHGIESDILSAGALDCPESILKEFDFVIASVHSGFRMKKEDMTKRLVTALANPYTTWLGHMSGRLLLGRPGYEFDLCAVLEAAEKHGKGMELNANPYRLDIDWRLIPEAVGRGIEIGIFPDAHSVEGLKDVDYGVLMARKALCMKEQISNTKPLEEMKAWLARH